MPEMRSSKNAPMYIGDCELLTSVDIVIKFDPSFVPTIEIKQNYICKTAYNRIVLDKRMR